MRTICGMLGWVALICEVLQRSVGASDETPRDDPAVAGRVEDLLRSMTIAEKVGQMTQADLAALKDKSDIQKYALGSVLSSGDSASTDISPGGWAVAYNECQSWALKTRLKVPLIYGIDAVHGHNKVDGAVIFPHNIGLGATRNPSLVERAARITAAEVTATGIRWNFAPCIAVALDARWGRTYESFGESPELVTEMGVAVVRGLQGERLSDPGSVLACAKHFLGDGGTTDGVDQGNTQCDQATLRRIHLPGFIAAVKAGVGSVMVSYSSWNGVKMHAQKRLLTDLLKGELGFRGIVVSDWGGVDQVADDYKKAVETAINAGIDMVMVPFGPSQKNDYVRFHGLLQELVAEGRVSQVRVDDAVRRILRTKVELDLFERPRPDPKAMETIGSAAHREVARECVRQSLVLLKNERKVLPLSARVSRLHVAGRAAADLGIQCGGWTISWQGKKGQVVRGGTTILAAIRKVLGPDTRVTYSADGSGAAGADAALVVVGECPYAEMKGDRHDLALTDDDVAVVRRAKDSGVPVVTVLLSGRPLVLGPVLDWSDAFVAAWLPGTEGQGVADVLFGTSKPTGTLPRSWPRTADQVHRNDTMGDPQFPYGFGLTY
jgi:beta-glucosidase